MTPQTKKIKDILGEFFLIPKEDNHKPLPKNKPTAETDKTSGSPSGEDAILKDVPYHLDGDSSGELKMNKIYNLKDKDELTFTGKQLREFKEKIIEEYKMSEYQSRKRAKAIREGFLEGIDTIKQWIINEENLDPEPCCHGVKINAIVNQIESLKKQGDKRFVLDEKHLNIIKEMLKEGYSKNQIAKELEVSSATISYWTNSRFRKRQMEKNAKRRFGKRLVPIQSSFEIKENDNSNKQNSRR